MSNASELTTPGGFHLSFLRAGDGGAGKPLLVLLPGGTYTAAYFDVEGHSLLDAAAARGFQAVAIDRPNYGGSDSLPDDQTTFAENARILSEAIGELWSAAPADSPGVVIIAHSIGGAIGVHIAAAERDWPLLGLAFSGVNETSPDHVVQAWQSVPAGVRVELTNEQRRTFMYGPDGTFDPAVLEAAAGSGGAAPLPELLEIVGGWVTDIPALTARVNVPLHYTLAENDGLWLTGKDRVDAFVARFSRAPFVESQQIDGVGHNIDHHYAGPEFHRSQLDFAERCGRQDAAEQVGAESLHDSV